MNNNTKNKRMKSSRSKSGGLGGLMKLSCFVCALVFAWSFVGDNFCAVKAEAKSATSSSYTEKYKKGKEDSKSKSGVDIAEPDFELSDVFYYYTSLSGEELKIYKLMLQGMNSHEDSILLPANIENKLRPIYDMVMFDHPELFWVEKSFGYYNYSDRTVLMPDYNRTKKSRKGAVGNLYCFAQFPWYALGRRLRL